MNDINLIFSNWLLLVNKSTFLYTLNILLYINFITDHISDYIAPNSFIVDSLGS